MLTISARKDKNGNKKKTLEFSQEVNKQSSNMHNCIQHLNDLTIEQVNQHPPIKGLITSTIPSFANAGIWQHIDFPPPVGIKQKQSLPVKQNIYKEM